MMHDLPGLLLILSDMNLVEDCTYIQKHTLQKVKMLFGFENFYVFDRFYVSKDEYGYGD